ncbi:MAG: tyrosine-type recombinase/integrase [Dysgonomonas sp.]
MIEATPYLVDKNKEKTSLQFIIRLKGQRLRFVPGITIETKFWIDNKKWCKENKLYPDGHTINVQIKKYKDIIENILLDFQEKLITPTQKTFKAAVQLKIDEINYEQGGVVSDNKQKEIEEFEKTQLFIPFADSVCDSSYKNKHTLKSYRTIINKLKEYEQEKGLKLKFDDINMSFYNDYRKFLLEQDYSKNYIGASFKKIIYFMNEASDIGLYNFVKPKGFKVESEDADTISLTEEEINKIYNINFTRDLIKEKYPDLTDQNIQSKIKSLNTERDRFIIGYCTALRISDYSRIDDLNIKDGLITIWTKKKDKKVYLPMHHYLKTIIGKYGGLKLPKISDQKHNEQIKDVCKLAGIDTPIRKTITKGGKRIESVEPKYKFVTSHTARRSGATNMYRNKIDILYISRLLGHSKIEQTMKYLKITTKELAETLKENPYFTGEYKSSSGD